MSVSGVVKAGESLRFQMKIWQLWWEFEVANLSVPTIGIVRMIDGGWVNLTKIRNITAYSPSQGYGPLSFCTGDSSILDT